MAGRKPMPALWPAAPVHWGRIEATTPTEDDPRMITLISLQKLLLYTPLFI